MPKKPERYFMLWERHWKAFEKLPNEFVGKAVKAMGRIMFSDGINPIDDEGDTIALTPYITEAETMREKAISKSNQNAVAGAKGGNAKADKIKKEQPETTPQAPPGFDDPPQTETSPSIDQLIPVWNEVQRPGMVRHRGTSASFSGTKLGDIVRALSGYSTEELIGSVRNLGRLYDKAKDTGEKLPTRLDSFLASGSFQRWTDEAKPGDRYEKKAKPEKVARAVGGQEMVIL